MLNHSASDSLHLDFDWRIICEDYDMTVLLSLRLSSTAQCDDRVIFFVWRQFAVFVDINLMVY